MTAVRLTASRRVLAAAAVLALSTLAVTACASEPEPEPVQLSISEAGGAYLDAVCPVNDSWEELDFAVDQLRLALDAGGDSTIAEDNFAQALGDLGASSLSAARELEDPDQVWPQGSAGLVKQVADSLRDDTAETKRLGKLDPTQAVGRSWPGAAESAETAAAARVALGLPADSTAACAERPAPTPEPTAKPEATTKPGETVKPDATTKPGETVKPDVTTKPGETTKPDVTTKPDATTKPGEGAKP